MGGRPPKSTDQLKLEKGDLYGDQKARDEAEPKPKEKLIPRCPRHLTPDQKKQWKYFAKVLENYGLLDAANAAHLEMLAVNVAMWRDCIGQMTSQFTVDTLQGGEKVNPMITAKANLEAQIRADLAQLGLSSQGLAKLGQLSAQKKKKDGMEGLMD